jgi:DNA polymerase III epsilon subunit-like protein
VNDSVNSSWQSTFQEIGRPLVDTTFVVIDLETTGGAPHLGAGITEIGAVKICRGEVVAEFETFIDPGHPIPSYITDLTGITDEMVALPIVPVIEIPGYGNEAAAKVRCPRT